MASKEDFDPEEELKFEDASGEISPAEMEMIKTLRSVGFQPKVGSVDDIMRLTTIFSQLRSDFGHDKPKPPPEPAFFKHDIHHYPKFSIFYGEEGRGEVNWDNFYFEVRSVVNTHKFSEEEILFLWIST